MNMDIQIRSISNRKRNWKRRDVTKEVMFDYNNTRPSEDEEKEILKGTLGIVRPCVY